MASMIATFAASALRPTGSFSTSACEQLVRQRNIEAHRTNHVTRAVLCDTTPAACVTEMLFAHEFYWSERQAAAAGGIKCAKWRTDDEWPTVEPHLTRPPDLGGLWTEVLQRLPNQTVWLHGDSIMTQVCEASLCSLARSRVVPQPPLCSHGRDPRTPPCTDVDAVSRSTGMQLRGVRLPNGAMLLCSAVGVLERDKIAAVLEKLPRISVALINYGLHYHSAYNFGAMLDELYGLLSSWADAVPGRVPLWRELSAQHFKGGSWTPGAHKCAHAFAHRTRAHRRRARAESVLRLTPRHAALRTGRLPARRASARSSTLAVPRTRSSAPRTTKTSSSTSSLRRARRHAAWASCRSTT
jgi:hypothetical protein